MANKGFFDETALNTTWFDETNQRNGWFDETLIASTSTTSYSLSCAAGSYTATGQAATFSVGHFLSAANGTYSVAGQSATLTKTGGSTAYSLSCAAGTYSLSGQTATFSVGHFLAADFGAYTYTGQAATFVKTGVTAYALNGEFGAYVFSGGVASFNRAGNRASDAGSGKYTADEVIHWLRTLFPRKQSQSKPRKRERESVSVVRQYAKRVESVSHAELDRALSDARELDALIQAYRQYLDAEQALQIQRAIDDEVGRKLAAYFAREAEQRARHAIVQWVKRQDDELAFLLIALEV